MALVQRDLGPRSPWGRFRLAVERFDSLLLDVLARRRADPGDDSMLARAARAARRGRQPAERPPPARPARGAARGRPRHLGGVAGVGVRAARAPSRRPGAAARGRPGLPRRGREGGRCASGRRSRSRRAGCSSRSTIAGRALPAGVHVAACLWLAMRREDLWPDAAAFRPERWLDGAPAEPAVVDPVRRRRAPLRRRAVRRDGDARGAARGRRAADDLARSGPSPSARAAARSSSRRTAAARCSPGGARRRSPARAARTGGAASACCRRGRRRTPCGRRRCRRCRP